MPNHPSRSCSHAHRSVLVARMATASFVELSYAYGHFRKMQNHSPTGTAYDGEIVLIDVIAGFRFGKKWRDLMAMSPSEAAEFIEAERAEETRT